MERNTRNALILCGIFLVLWALWGQLSPGTYDDDDVTHYFVARESFEKPENLISLWGRPLFTLLYAVPARIGYGAVELFTATLMALTLFVTWRIARRLEIRPAWAVIPLVAWQPLVFKLGFSSLVEPLGALALGGALLAYLTNRDRAAALLAGLLPLTRFELIVLAPFLLLPIWRRSPGVTFLLAALPLLVWNLGGWLFEGDPIWLVSQILNNEFGRSFAGAQPLDHYLRALPFVTGGVVIVPLFLGLLSPWREGMAGRALVRAMVVTFLAVLSFLAWEAHEFGGSVGYLRHLVSVGPLIGLVAGMGLMRWRTVGRRDALAWAGLLAGVALAVAACVFRKYEWIYEHPVRRDVEPWMVAVAAGAAALLLVLARRRWWLPGGIVALAGISTFISEPPIPLDVERRAVRDIVDFVDQQSGVETVAVNHPWFFFLSGASRLDPIGYPRVTVENLERLRPGSLVVWENHYSHRLQGDVDLKYLADRPERFLPRAKDDVDRVTPDGRVTSQFLYVIFEVVRPDDPRLGGRGPSGRAPDGTPGDTPGDAG